MALRGKAQTISESQSGIKQTGAHLAGKRSMTPEFTQVPISDIRPATENARGLKLTLEQLSNPEDINDPAMRDEAEYIVEMSRTMQDHGQLQPGIGYRTNGGAIELIAGERRWWACQLAGFDEMKVMVYPERPDDQAVRQLVENLHRRNLDAAGTLRALLQVLNERESAGSQISSGAELMTAVRMPKTVAYRWWGIINGPREVCDAILAGLITSPDVGKALVDVDEKTRQHMLDTGDFSSLSEKRKAAKAKEQSSHKSDVVPPRRRPGRRAQSFNLGKIKSPRVAEYIIKSVDPHGDYSDVNWNDVNAINALWRSLLTQIESGVKGGQKD